jgi:acyl-CoA thioester hydrolase
MDPVFRLQLKVSPEVVDANRHVNNVAYVQWMQDAAIGHAEACGGARLAQEPGGSWFVRMHRIEYLKPAFLNDEITVLTWVANWRKVRSLRRYRFIRNSDRAILAEGETEWVFVDAATGRPKTIPEQIVSIFGVVSDGPAAPTAHSQHVDWL